LAQQTSSMNITNLLKTAVISLLIFHWFSLPAQQTKYYDDPKAAYRIGLELIGKKQFGAAQEVFGRLMDDLPVGESVMRLEAGFYDALCDYYLNHPQAGEKFAGFVRSYPDHTKTNLAFLHLGLIEYGSRRYRNAIEYFEKTDPFRLNAELMPEYLYKLGYSYIQRENFTKAKEAFFPILNTPSEYRDAANYYYAYIAYQENDFVTALFYFEKIQQNSEFAGEIPFYLLQIYYVNNEFDKITDKGPGLLQRDINDRKKLGELSRMVAEAFYRQNDFGQAIVYFDKYIADSRKALTRDENYQVAYSYYMAGNYERAVSFFEKSISGDDEMSQNAYYHLADCYLKTDRKNFAQNAFYSAYLIPINDEIREDALFNYAKLTFELAYDPFGSSIDALVQYITDYPASPRIDEAYSYLTSLFLSSRDYQASINAIERIRIKNKDLLKAYQQLTFQRGVQHFNAGRYDLAAENFRKTLGNNLIQSLTVQTKFWMGETFFHTGDYPRAIDYYDDFMTSPGASNFDVYHLTKYNLGYAYFKMKYYDNAVVAFQQFVSRQVSGGETYIADALLRIGDCNFVTNNYDQAVSYYNQAVSSNSPNSDYAIFQKALSEGAQGMNEMKIVTMKEMISNYPRSPYADDATYEIADTYLLLNDDRNAMEWFSKLLAQYPNSSYVYRSLQKTGLIHYNRNELDQALDVLKQLVTAYSATTEARDALLTIRNIYLDKNDVGSYFSFAENIPFANVTASEQDSITYLAAENLYLNNECIAAIQAFGNYLQQFENGSFTVQANYYKAECDYSQGNKAAALEGYEYVTRFPKSRFSENSLLRLSGIYFDDEEWEKALENFASLETIADYQANVTTAINGQMESYFRLNNYYEASEAAQKLKSRDNLTNEQMIRINYITGKSALMLDDISRARAALKNTVNISQAAEGAEAKFLLASIEYQNGNTDLAEEMVIELAGEYPAFEYWKARGFILLSDIYARKGNTFQAKQTLQSIIQHYPGDDLKEVASQKLATIVREDEEKQQLREIEEDNENEQ
jgi:TolA-binding protein